MSRLFLGFLKVFVKKLSPRRGAAEMVVTGDFIGRMQIFFYKSLFYGKNYLASFLFAGGAANRRVRRRRLFDETAQGLLLNLEKKV